MISVVAEPDPVELPRTTSLTPAPLLARDPIAGAVLVKTLDRKTGQTRLYAEATGAEGGSIWMQPSDSQAESDLDAYVARAARIDPDIWVVEIEDADGARFLTEAVEGR